MKNQGRKKRKAWKNHKEIKNVCLEIKHHLFLISHCHWITHSHPIHALILSKFSFLFEKEVFLRQAMHLLITKLTIYIFSVGLKDLLISKAKTTSMVGFKDIELKGKVFEWMEIFCIFWIRKAKWHKEFYWCMAKCGFLKHHLCMYFLGFLHPH